MCQPHADGCNGQRPAASSYVPPASQLALFVVCLLPLRSLGWVLPCASEYGGRTFVLISGLVYLGAAADVTHGLRRTLGCGPAQVPWWAAFCRLVHICVAIADIFKALRPGVWAYSA